MTFRTALARYLRTLLDEPEPSPDVRQPQSHLWTTSTPTPSTSNGADPQVAMMKMMTEMFRESQRETRELVLSILQGRPSNSNGFTSTDLPTSESTATIPMPNYDDDSIPLSGGIQAVFEREQAEEDAVRRLRTEQQNLAHQLEEARARVMTDPQGPDFMTS